MNEQQNEAVEAVVETPELRVTPERIDALVVAGQFHRFENTTVTVCCLTLVNGFNVVGTSACADPNNFNEELGKELAFADAKKQIWKLEGYLLRQWMFLEEVGALHQAEVGTAELDAASKGPAIVIAGADVLKGLAAQGGL